MHKFHLPHLAFTIASILFTTDYTNLQLAVSYVDEIVWFVPAPSVESGSEFDGSVEVTQVMQQGSPLITIVLL